MSTHFFFFFFFFQIPELWALSNSSNKTQSFEESYDNALQVNSLQVQRYLCRYSGFSDNDLLLSESAPESWPYKKCGFGTKEVIDGENHNQYRG